MVYQEGDILSVPLFAHTRHFFVYIGDGEVIGWGPWDEISWMGGKGSVSRKKLFKDGDEYKYLGTSGELQAITLERRTRASKEAIDARIMQMAQGIDYHAAHRNCEHFACYITGVTIRSEQSVGLLFTDYEPFSIMPMICNLNQLRDALLRCKHCGPSPLTKREFEKALLINKLDDGFFVYHFNHPLGGQHIYVTPIAKTKDFIASYDSIILAYYGALVGRGEIFGIVRQVQGR